MATLLLLLVPLTSSTASHGPLGGVTQQVFWAACGDSKSLAAVSSWRLAAGQVRLLAAAAAASPSGGLPLQECTRAMMSCCLTLDPALFYMTCCERVK